jgi:hypothetical protein
MKRFALVLAAVSVAAILCFLLVPPPGAPGPILEKPARSAGSGPEVAPRHQPAPDPALERAESSRREAEEHAAVLERRLDAVEKAKSAAAKMKRPFADPDMRKVMTKEAESGAERAVAALMDAGLAADLGMDEAAQSALRGLLQERAGIGFKQLLIPMAAGELEGGRLTDAARRVREAYAKSDAQIRSLLGDQGYAVYAWYEKTQADRDTVKQLAPQFGRAGHELTADQQTQLVTLLTQERAGFHFEQDFSDPTKIDYEHFHQVFSLENTDRYFRDLQRFHDQLAQHAGTVLSPEQSRLLQEFLAAQVQRSKLTVRTTMTMMGNQP